MAFANTNWHRDVKQDVKDLRPTILPTQSVNIDYKTLIDDGPVLLPGGEYICDRHGDIRPVRPTYYSYCKQMIALCKLAINGTITQEQFEQLKAKVPFVADQQ